MVFVLVQIVVELIQPGLQLGKRGGSLSSQEWLEHQLQPMLIRPLVVAKEREPQLSSTVAAFGGVCGQFCVLPGFVLRSVIEDPKQLLVNVLALSPKQPQSFQIGIWKLLEPTFLNSPLNGC